MLGQVRAQDPKFRREEGLPRPILPLQMLDGRSVWEFHQTEGTPFEQLFAQLALSGFEPCWSEFFMAAVRQKGRDYIPVFGLRIASAAERCYADHPQVVTRIQKVAERIGGRP